MSGASLSLDLATRLAEVGLANVTRPYPRKVDHLLGAPGELVEPRAVHPAFYGSFDWHSAVHMHWLLARVLRLSPAVACAAAIELRLDAHLSAPAIQAELAYFRSAAGRLFERPYGWAWLLKLQAELVGTRWATAVAPLAAELAGRLRGFVEGAPYPIRAGSHGNTAFASLLALDYAHAAEDEALHSSIAKAAHRWYAMDCDAPLAYEPSLDDFLSPALVEACLMQEVLPASAFAVWRRDFLPQGIAVLAEPPRVADRTDPKQAHLDGLSLSRAWCLRRLGFEAQAQRLVEGALPYLTGDYAGEHWLASFALLALSEGAPTSP